MALYERKVDDAGKVKYTPLKVEGADRWGPNDSPICRASDGKKVTVLKVFREPNIVLWPSRRDSGDELEQDRLEKALRSHAPSEANAYLGGGSVGFTGGVNNPRGHDSQAHLDLLEYHAVTFYVIDESDRQLSDDR